MDRDENSKRRLQPLLVRGFLELKAKLDAEQKQSFKRRS